MQDRLRGCLLAGAAGDALGYAVEFLSEEMIFRHWGERGITVYRLKDGRAGFSDDTQMTLFTANGLLLAAARKQDPLTCIRDCYRDWLITQGEQPAWTAPGTAWLAREAELCHRRAPGRTCISYLLYDNLGSPEDPRNQSKGCGGVMRSAPIGLIAMADDEADLLAARAAALTHGHELGYLPAAMLAHLVRCLALKGMDLLAAVEDASAAMERLFPDARHLPELLALTEKAVALAAQKDADPLDAIHELGEGWVAEETLAIAIYCALRFPDDIEQALIAAVNHSGDSDSTGAVTGNILGAHLGMKAIPEVLLAPLEAREIILMLADHLFLANQGADGWTEKYLQN